MAIITVNETDAEQVLVFANPDLYQKNIFRILGVPVTASHQEVKKRQKQLDMKRKLGIDQEDQSNDHELIALSNPDEETTKIALERLADPKTRLFNEIFWFWLLDDTNKDPGFIALEQGDVQGALNAWKLINSDTSKQKAIKTHNRVILNHLIAMELEAWIKVHPNLGLKLYKYKNLKIEILWVNVIIGWETDIGNDIFWQLVKDRVEILNDSQLTADTVDRIREMLPDVLLKLYAKIALETSARRDKNLAKIQVNMLYKLAKELNRSAENALQEVLKPISRQIDNLLEQAKQRYSEHADEGDKAFSDLLQYTWPLLRNIDTLLPDDNPWRGGIHDDIAKTALESLVAYGNETSNWSKFVCLLDTAIPIAVDNLIRDNMNKQRQAGYTNYKDNLCFMCKYEDADPACLITIFMHGDISISGDNFSYSWKEIKIPKCKNCFMSEGQKYNFPEIKELVAKGWQFGKEATQDELIRFLQKSQRGY